MEVAQLLLAGRVPAVLPAALCVGGALSPDHLHLAPDPTDSLPRAATCPRRSFQNIRAARDSICALILGSPAGKVYSKLHSVTARLSQSY